MYHKNRTVLKKLTSVVLAVLLIISCLCLSACGVFFNLLDEWFGDTTEQGGSGSGGHTHQFDSYFTYSQCAVDGCRVVGRNGSENTYANSFKYTLTNAKIAEINAVYNEIVTYLTDGGDYEQFEELYNDYLDYFEYVGHQYQVASILNDVTYNATTVNNYRTASQLYNDMFAKYYGLYALVYDSDYREQFYEGWNADEIEEALYYAKIYAGSADNNNVVDEILSEYEAYMDSIGWSFSLKESTKAQQLNKVGEIYAKLVDANNNLAKVYGDTYVNYMDYAYANEYNRDYTPDKVATTMRQFVKKYVAPLFIDVAIRYNTLLYHSSLNTNADKNFCYGLMYDSLFTDTSDANFNRVRTTIDYVGEYFRYVQKSAIDTGGQKFDFDSAVEDLFKHGNYFTGDYEGAYTWWIDAIEMPILYFGPDYDTAFTFVHEFGHYYNNIYNGALNLSYDHDETHSQGNEMLFLAWLFENKPANVTVGFDMVEMGQLFDMLTNIVIATAVDEFEQAAYSGRYNGQPITSYADLFEEILSSYKGTHEGNKYNTASAWLATNYWGYVVFNSSAYYISYAMSALPSLELYAMARSSGLDSARDSYVKLFTFANGHRFVDNDSNGNAYLKSGATYEAILNYCGLQGPFQEGLYTTLLTYFSTRADIN